jgi:TonB family protein
MKPSVFLLALLSSIAFGQSNKEPITVDFRALQAKGCNQPVYPSNARLADATGVTEILVTVNPQGEVVEAEVVKSAGKYREHRELDAASIATIRSCTFSVEASPEMRQIRTHIVWKLDR